MLAAGSEEIHAAVGELYGLGLGEIAPITYNNTHLRGV